MLFFEIFFKICAVLGAMAFAILLVEEKYLEVKTKREKAKEIEPETSKDEEVK